MARGLPAFWSAIVAVLFGAGGYYAQLSEQIPDQVGLALYGFAGATFLSGLFIQLRAPPKPNRIDHDAASVYHPSQKYAAWFIITGIMILAGGVYLFFYSTLPYAYPFVVLGYGALRTGGGLARYWKNSLTTYYVSEGDMLFFKCYRFFSRNMQPAKAENIDTMPSGQTLIERLLGVGHAKIVLRNESYPVHDVNDFDGFKQDMIRLLERTE